MAIVEEMCPSCGRPTAVHIGQAVTSSDRLVWSRAINCLSCGYTVEADDSDFPPKEYRDAVLLQDGCWTISVDDPKATHAVALVLMEALGMDRPTALRAAKAAGPIWTGSKAEVEWLRRRLAARAVGATLAENEKDD